MANAICTAIDDSDRVHFVFGVAHDILDDAATGVEPPEDFDGALAYTTWDATNGWATSSIIRGEVGGDISPREYAVNCHLKLAADDELRVVYDVTFVNEPYDKIVEYGRDTGSGWTFATVGNDLFDPSEFEFDAAGNLFFSASSPTTQGDEVTLVRVDPTAAAFSLSLQTFGNLSSTSSVWNPTTNEAVCRLLTTHRIVPWEYRVILTTVPDCDELW